MTLFAPTLESVIGDDDPVRLFDEVLAGSDWSLWEADYHGCVGQPAIHPAAAILYGLYRRVRSSRQLEEATHYRLDFIWLLHGRRIEHTPLPASLANLEHRRHRVRDALVQAQAAEETRRLLGRTPEKSPAQVPTTAPETRVMPNKDGGTCFV